MRLVFGPCDVFLSSSVPHKFHISHYTALTRVAAKPRISRLVNGTLFQRLNDA
jgi:hypothetical protein